MLLEWRDVLVLSDVHEDALVFDHVGRAARTSSMYVLRVHKRITVAANSHAFLLVDHSLAKARCPDVRLQIVLNLVGVLPFLERWCHDDVSPRSRSQLRLQHYRTDKADLLLYFLVLMKNCSLNFEPVVPEMLTRVSICAVGARGPGAPNYTVLSGGTAGVVAIVLNNVSLVDQFLGLTVHLRGCLTRSRWLD